MPKVKCAYCVREGDRIAVMIHPQPCWAEMRRLAMISVYEDPSPRRQFRSCALLMFSCRPNEVI
jgi:hypothetical protein